MSQPLSHLEKIATQISNLSVNDISRLTKLLVFSGDRAAADLLDHLQSDFKQLEKELFE